MAQAWQRTIFCAHGRSDATKVVPLQVTKATPEVHSPDVYLGRQSLVASTFVYLRTEGVKALLSRALSSIAQWLLTSCSSG